MFDFSSDYFALFELPVDYRLHPGQLGERYRALQRMVHPDRFASGSEQERRLSLQWATHVNQAYETLKDPLRRAQYLLSLHGVTGEARPRTSRDTAFLMEQMALREALAEIREAADPLGALEGLIERIAGLIRAEEERLAEQLEAPGEAELAAAGEAVQRLQFLTRLRSEAESLEAALEDEL